MRMLPPNSATHRAEYNAWNGMHHRCYNASGSSYASYGGRGIAVARMWHGPKGFHAFMRDLGPRPSVAHSLDRIDVNKNYSRKNCRWALVGVQARNKRTTRLVTLNGETKVFADWARHYGLSNSLVQIRIDKQGWDTERAFTTPARAVDQESTRYSEHSALTSAVQRCHNPNNARYADYGGRGITVVPEWRGRGSLARFKADMGPRPGAGYSLDRIDVNQGYGPKNCRWATRKEQVNNRRVTRWLTLAGETKTLADWSRSSGVSVATISERLQLGWPIAKALTQTALQKRRAAAKNPVLCVEPYA